MNYVYYVNGEFVPAATASLPLGDLGLVRGYGVFDLLRTYGRAPFRLREHIARLERSAVQVDLALPWSAEELEEIALETWSRNPDAVNCAIRIIVTGGESPSLLMPVDNPSLMVMISPLNITNPEAFATGASLITIPGDRFLPTVKSINYIGAIVALKQAKKAGAVEALYVGADGLTTECTTSNFFAFKGDTLITPDKGVLDGITRAAVLEVAEDIFTVDYRQLHKDEFATIDEAFITSTTKEILPIVRVDDTVIGDGKPGKNTRRLMATLHEFIAREVGVPA